MAIYLRGSPPTPLFNEKSCPTNTSIPRMRIFLLVGFLCSVVIFDHVFEWSKQQELKIMEHHMSDLILKYPKAKGSNPYDPRVTEQRLKKHYVYEHTGKPIPNSIFQMWRMTPASDEFPYRDLYQRWRSINPTYEYIFSTNDKIIELVRDEFDETVPEVIEALDLLPSLILKSDFSRYILVYLYGGTYADLDTYLEEPLSGWFDSHRDVGFVCGIEEDRNVPDWQSKQTIRLQLEQWVFKSQPRHPILRNLISTIVYTTFKAQKEEKLQAYWRDFRGIDRCKSVNIMEWTGPQVYTGVLFAYFNSLKNPTIIDTKTIKMTQWEKLHGPDMVPGIPIDWRFLTGIDAPLLIDDVVVYPMRSVREPDKNCIRGYCYLQHHYSGSWKGN